MKLLMAELRKQLPPLYAQEKDQDPMVYAKFFTPDAGWTWYVTEGSPEGDDFIFFGYVIGLEREWGYFSLNELQSVRGPLGLSIERDLYFTPQRFSNLNLPTNLTGGTMTINGPATPPAPEECLDPQWGARLQEYLDGLLVGKERIRFQVHLALCRKCQAASQRPEQAADPGRVC